MQRNTRFAIFLGIFTFLVYVFFQFPGFQGYEDETYNRIVENLASGEFKTARSGYAQTLLETPFVWKGQLIDRLWGISHDKMARFYALFYNPFVTALSAVAVFLILGLNASRRKAFWLALLYAFGTMAFPYAAIGMEPTAVLFMLLAVYFLFRFGRFQNSRDLVLSGLFYFLLFFSKAYYFVTIPAFAWYLLPAGFNFKNFSPIKKYFRSGLYFAAPLIFVLPLYLLANKYNFGVYFGGQYKLGDELGGGDNLIFGVYGLLLSFGKSLFIYNPALLLSVILFARFYRRFKQEAAFVAIYSVLLILFVAGIHWWSDETWGPRYLLSLSAVGLLPLIVLTKADFGGIKKWLPGFVIAASFLFQLLGASARYDVFPYTFYEIYGATGYNVLASQEYQYIPQFAPYLVNFELLKNKLLDQRTPIEYKIIYTPPMEMAAGERGQAVIKNIAYDNNKYQAHVLNFWWMNVPGISPYRLLGLFLLIFAALCWWGRSLLRQTKRSIRL